MKATKVTYSRLISKGNYENAKIEIELEVEENEKASDVFLKAKEFVENRIAVEKVQNWEIANAIQVLKEAKDHSIDEIKEAKQVLDQLVLKDDLPF